MGELQLRLSGADLEDGPVSHLPIGRLLLKNGKIRRKDLIHALKLQEWIDAPLGDIMVAEGLVERADVLSALAVQARTEGADLELDPPAPEMAAHLPAAMCLRHGVVPWREDDRAVYVAASSPAGFSDLCRSMGPSVASLLFPVIVDEQQIMAHQSRLFGTELAEKAAIRVPAAESCRTWEKNQNKRLVWAAALVGLLCTTIALAPVWVLTAGVLWALITLCMTTTLKAATLLSHLSHRAPPITSSTAKPFRMPRVSVLVPLLREKEIAGQLIARLSQLTYPKSLLNIVLVLEEGDSLTRDMLERTDLPDWMSVIEVPEAGNLTTKPRALNYALDFCRGSIVGVWDAEDWPEPDQIEKVVTRFNAAPDNVVCLQGILDYYNSRTNWLSRCFTIEYAMWWRIIMPGIARLGLVVPLGGTTLFFKRRVLEELGGWDAHNVTEDADLGVRLARHGYVTELLPTVTREESTSRTWPWIRQRSRWLKGFLVTYFVHMRSPRKLLKDLGFWRFMGIQTLFLASVSQFAAVPLLWSFWSPVFGLAHPVSATLGVPVMWGVAGIFITAELLNIAIGIIAVSGRGHRHLIAFVPTMAIYFTLGAVAAYKAMWELIRQPFFWDKTQHGLSALTDHSPPPEPELQRSS